MIALIGDFVVRLLVVVAVCCLAMCFAAILVERESHWYEDRSADVTVRSDSAMSLIICRCSHSQWSHFAASGMCTVGNCSCREFRRAPVEAERDAARDGILNREFGVA